MCGEKKYLKKITILLVFIMNNNVIQNIVLLIIQCAFFTICVFYKKISKFWKLITLSIMTSPYLYIYL